ncbi:MAG: nitroreductase family protein [Candidatus Bathycorpusculaceae bacterium]
MELMEAIKGRRSVRAYKSRRVGREKIRKILEAARWAPSWANTQCWEFVVVRDPETKRELSETLSKGNPATEAVASAPLVLVACAKKGLSGFYHNRPATSKGDWYMFDMGLAIQNLTLAAYSLGLGTVNVGSFNAEDAAKILGVSENVVVVELIPLGYPEKTPNPTPRKSFKDFVFYDKYGNRKRV